ncbi:MAG TPA: hypothetical protein VJO33_20090 [Gemmatimonadaceae bacterium]|nr:hypothetical protein [Gemmatimonadaceae bacterium]
MTIGTGRTLTWGFVVVAAFGAARSAIAQTGIGTWVRQPTPSMPGTMTMTVQACCNGGRRLIYHFLIEKKETVLTVESGFDGKEAPVLIDGKPSGETMAIKLVDDHHTSTVLKMNGTFFGTSNATLSPDGKTLTVLNDFSSSVGGNPAGKSTEVWMRK